MRARGLLILLVLLGPACVFGGDTATPPRPAPPPKPAAHFAEVACGLPRPWLRRLWNGYHPERAGDVQMLVRADASFSFAHAGPWPFLQRIPLFVYGPGHVGAAGEIGRPVEIADVPPTLAAHLGVRFDAPDGRVLDEARPRDDRKSPPRLVVVMVWDGGGMNLLERWPEAWPTLRRLRGDGVWYERATLGTSPSITPPVHSTLGTGAYPRRHGVTGIYIRTGERVVPTAGEPEYLLLPTLADVYDRERGNRPRVGLVAYEDWHLGMLGHGAGLGDGDRDIAVLLNNEAGRWGLPSRLARHFEFPAYVNDVGGRDEAVRKMDLEDGRVDGTWRGQEVVDDPLALLRTPAYADWQTAVIGEVIRREGFGQDEIPDLLLTNYKMIDEVGHWWGLDSTQMEGVVEATDRALGELVEILDQEVGEARWVLVVTADHGVIPGPRRADRVLLSREEFQKDLAAAFDEDGDDRDALLRFRPTELWFDRAELEENGYTLEQVATWIMEYKIGENLPDAPAEVADTPAFEAAFPGRVLTDLPCLSPRGAGGS